MRLKLFNKFFLTTSFIIIFSLAVMMMILSFVLNNYIAKSKQQILLRCCDEIGEQINTAVTQGESIDTLDLTDTVKTLTSVYDSDVFITDQNGRVFVCGCVDFSESGSCLHSVNTVSYTEIAQNLHNGEVGLSDLGVYQAPHYVAMSLLKNSQGELMGTVYAAAPVTAVSRLLSTVVKLYLVSAMIPLILMFLSIYAMTYRLTKPLKSMSQASKAMAKGDFSKRIPVMSDDEIGELSMSFNMMTNSLAQLEGMRKSFVANVSHELKTPMTTIGGFIDGILDGTIPKDKQDYYLNIVSDEVKRLTRLVNSMLSMSKLESGEFALKPELFDLGELLVNIVLSQEQRIEKSQLEIIGLDEMESVCVNADKDLIHQVIYNLVDNAIKFNQPNGSIKFGLKTEGKFAVFTITNTGKGIPQKDLPHIFERFYKGDKARSGVKNSTGLGLYIVKTIINSHAGTIRVSAKENEATSFIVTLPL